MLSSHPPASDVANSSSGTSSCGLVLVVVRCAGAVPSLFAPLGDLLPLEATGRAVEEGT
jgi:hypothetical protein